MMKIRVGRLVAFATGLLLASCSGGVEPTAERLEGAYFGLTFATTTPAVVIDHKALGGRLEVDLLADGILTGQLVAPTGFDGGNEVRTDLAGTWTLADEHVVLEPTAATVLRGMRFEVDHLGQLVGEQAHGDGAVTHIVLRPYGLID